MCQIQFCNLVFISHLANVRGEAIVCYEHGFTEKWKSACCKMWSLNAGNSCKSSLVAECLKFGHMTGGDQPLELWIWIISSPREFCCNFEQSLTVVSWGLLYFFLNWWSFILFKNTCLLLQYWSIKEIGKGNVEAQKWKSKMTLYFNL